MVFGSLGCMNNVKIKIIKINIIKYLKIKMINIVAITYSSTLLLAGYNVAIFPALNINGRHSIANDPSFFSLPLSILLVQSYFERYLAYPSFSDLQDPFQNSLW